MIRRLRQGFAGCLLLVAAVTGGFALAQGPAGPTPPAPRTIAANTGGPSWQSLTAQQRNALAPLQADWNGIDASRKAKWLDIARRYPHLPPDEQQRIHGRMAEWSRLSPSERARARLNFQETKQISPQDRQAKWQAYQALPESERKALASRAGPGAGAKAAGAAETPPAAAPAAAAKRNIVANPSLTHAPAKPVAPTVVQAAPGATTTLVTRQPKPPAHQQSDMPKIAATPGFVDQTTLLPKRGPQGAATRSASGSALAPPKSP